VAFGPAAPALAQVKIGMFSRARRNGEQTFAGSKGPEE
jgi:hypothetical protein